MLAGGPEALIPVRLAGEPWTGAADGIAGARPAAVLVLIAPDDGGEARVVLTERSTYDGHHSGEVSFPGGRGRARTPDLVATALREAGEEIGARRRRQPASASCRRASAVLDPGQQLRVTPVVAVADRRPTHPGAGRGRPVVDAPVAAFLPGAPIRLVERDIRGWAFAMPPTRRFGEACGVGATARVLGGLGAWLATRDPRLRTGGHVGLEWVRPSRVALDRPSGREAVRRSSAGASPPSAWRRSPGPAPATALEDRRSWVVRPGRTRRRWPASGRDSVRAPWRTPAGQRTASPAATRRSSSPTST